MVIFLMQYILPKLLSPENLKLILEYINWFLVNNLLLLYSNIFRIKNEFNIEEIGELKNDKP